MAIKTLRMAGMKIWMITGDKMETAINIALSCQLIVNKDSILVLQAEHHWGKNWMCPVALLRTSLLAQHTPLGICFSRVLFL